MKLETIIAVAAIVLALLGYLIRNTVNSIAIRKQSRIGECQLDLHFHNYEGHEYLCGRGLIHSESCICKPATIWTGSTNYNLIPR